MYTLQVFVKRNRERREDLPNQRSRSDSPFSTTLLVVQHQMELDTMLNSRIENKVLLWQMGAGLVDTK